MRKTNKNLFTTLGAISMIMGLAVIIPSYLNENYIGFSISLLFVIFGAVFLSIGFGD